MVGKSSAPESSHRSLTIAEAMLSEQAASIAHSTFSDEADLQDTVHAILSGTPAEFMALLAVDPGVAHKKLKFVIQSAINAKQEYNQLSGKHSALTAAYELLQDEQDDLLDLNDGILREYAPHLLQEANSALKIKQLRQRSSDLTPASSLPSTLAPHNPQASSSKRPDSYRAKDPEFGLSQRVLTLEDLLAIRPHASAEERARFGPEHDKHVFRITDAELDTLKKTRPVREPKGGKHTRRALGYNKIGFSDTELDRLRGLKPVILPKGGMLTAVEFEGLKEIAGVEHKNDSWTVIDKESWEAAAAVHEAKGWIKKAAETKHSVPHGMYPPSCHDGLVR